MRWSVLVGWVAASAAIPSLTRAQAASNHDAAALVAAFTEDTPLLRDLAELTDQIGGRATGSAANARAADWAVARFKQAGVSARKEPFTVPRRWLERSARARIQGDGVDFSVRVAAMPFSAPTPTAGAKAPLLDAGAGAETDFKRLGARAKGSFLLIEQSILTDIDGLFREYAESYHIEQRAFAAGAAGVVYMGSRPNDLLYRHNVSIASKNTRPMIVMERDAAARALRMLRSGKALTLTEYLDLDVGGSYESWNVVGEIRGSARPEEIVLLGAHLDSWDLGDGALDNGANAMMVVDVARQIVRLGLKPARTIRFVLWSGEEQGFFGSLGYTRAHAAELDRHLITMTHDIGCGRINGYFTNGRADVLAPLERALEPVRGLGPFTQVNAPVVGTDNFDFMLQGVANLIANQESASYGPNYHARSDTFDKCDPQQLRLNAAVAAAVTWGFAQMDVKLPRQSRAQLEELMRTTDLADQMKMFAVWDGWADGTRGRK
ncbi:MAG TPA: M28 family peptidase [Gemmatimonadales bacterium]|nr:M28 family peptidase [Gemmatimonadales bacterium]